MKTYKLLFDFEFGELNNSIMDLTITYNDKTKKVIPNDNLLATVEIDIPLPCKILLTTSGKNPNDTNVDENGNITGDKFIKINRIKLDNFEMNEMYMHQYIGMRDTSGNWHTGCYLGFNGDMLIDFKMDDILDQFLECNFFCIYEDQPRPTFKKGDTTYGMVR